MGRRRKVITTVYLDPGQLDQLKSLAEIDETSRSVVIRQAIGSYLEKRRIEIQVKKQSDLRQIPFFDEDDFN